MYDNGIRAFYVPGEVRHYAKLYINGVTAAEATMPPYRVVVTAQSGDELKIIVANTPANVTRSVGFFKVQELCDADPYHAKMKINDHRAPAGGLINPVKIYKILN